MREVDDGDNQLCDDVAYDPGITAPVTAKEPDRGCLPPRNAQMDERPTAEMRHTAHQ